jgi:glycosyl transferase family 11
MRYSMTRGEISRPFVTCKLSGRTGNNCFQIMTTIAHALKHGVEYKIPSFTKSKYTKNCPFNQFPKLTEEDEKKIEYEHYQNGWDYKEIPYKPNMRISGWYQNYQYFDEHRKEIIEAFNLPKEKIDAVAVHVRRGDYRRYPTKHPVLGEDYYFSAFKNLTVELSSHYPLPKVDVFSDDEEAKTFMPGASEYFINGDPLEDWIKMTQYKYFIIANSTYSWTAAYLSGSGNVIAPHESRWYGPRNSHIYTGELIPKNWIKI